MNDIAIELAATSAGFRRSLPPRFVIALADLVRAMNCYYSNLIEGHHTHPVDIERAMKNDYSADPEQRNRFSELLPDELLVASNPATGKSVKVIAGELRQDDVQVGRHLAISPGAVPRFIDRSNRHMEL